MMASFLKKNYSVILLIIISMCVGLYISISPILKEKAAQAVFLSKEKEWNYLANNKAEFKDVTVVLQNDYLKIKEFDKLEFNINEQSLLIVKKSKRFTLISVNYDQKQCVIGLVSENGVLYESSNFEEIFKKGCISL